MVTYWKKQSDIAYQLNVGIKKYQGKKYGSMSQKSKTFCISESTYRYCKCPEGVTELLLMKWMYMTDYRLKILLD